MNNGFDKIMTRTFKVTIPLNAWDEWNKDCEDNFNGTRYLKMKFDHEFRKQFGTISEMIIGELQEMKARVAYLEQKVLETKPETKVPRKTLGGQEY